MPHRLLFVLLTLYFAQGLPSGFITQALPAILRDYGVSLEMIGLSGILLAPWALKFLWAPAVDRYFSPKLGQAKSWILPLQVLSALIVFAVGFVDPTQLSNSQTLWAVYGMLFCLSLVGATHDVATDGLATRSLAHASIAHTPDETSINPPPIQSNSTAQTYQTNATLATELATEALTTAELTDVLQTTSVHTQHQSQTASAPVNTSETDTPNPLRGIGNAIQVTGYRMGLILGGGVFLWLLGVWSWQTSFWLMAGLIVLNTVPIALFKEQSQSNVSNPILPSNRIKPTTVKKSLNWQRLTAYLQKQYGYFWQSREMRAWLLVLLTFKIVDGVSSGMVKPMMVDMGIATQDIGLWVSVLGSGASLVGAGVAAVFLRRMAHAKALLWFNALQVATTGLYLLVALAFEYGIFLSWTHATTVPFWWAYTANAVEHFVASLALVAMLSMVMHYARPGKAGSDFTTQVCLLTVFSGLAHLISGFIASNVGYSGHFAISVALGVLCLLPIVVWQHISKAS